jgi:hypothetical protein
MVHRLESNSTVVCGCGHNQGIWCRRRDLNPHDLAVGGFSFRPENTRAQWMLPPEVLNPSEFGKPDQRIDIYHCGLLLLQLEHSKELQFTKEEILEGKPRDMALALRAPYNFALEKALRRHVSKRTETARELWRDLNSPVETQEALPPPPATEPVVGGPPDAEPKQG